MYTQVLYIPDQDEIARSAPKSAPPHLTLTSSGQFPGSVDSEDTLRSSSVSGPLPDGNQEGGEEGEGEGQESKCEDKAEEEKNGEEAFSPSTSKGHELFEEVADTHIVVVSRYISDDQVPFVCPLSCSLNSDPLLAACSGLCPWEPDDQPDCHDVHALP